MDGSRGRICSGILHLVFIENGEERRSSLGRKIGGNYDNRKGQINHYWLVQHSCCCILAKSRLTLQPQGLRHARLLCPWDFSGKNIEMRCCILLQEIIPTQRLNPRLLLAGRFFTTEPIRSVPLKDLIYISNSNYFFSLTFFQILWILFTRNSIWGTTCTPCNHNDLITTTTTTKSLQSCPTVCDPVDGSPPGFPVPGILQARTLEWVAISFSNAWK